MYNVSFALRESLVCAKSREIGYLHLIQTTKQPLDKKGEAIFFTICADLRVDGRG
jgi:hypothetical protein